MSDYILNAHSAVMHLKATDVPGVEFEYHPETKQVYMLDLATKKADLIFHPCGNVETARAVVAIWCCGYEFGRGKSA